MIDPESETIPVAVSWHHSRLIIYTMLLFGAVSAFFALLSYAADDFRSTTLFAITSAAVFLGLLTQMLAGLNTGIRIYYACCGAATFLYLIAAGGPEETGLFGCLAIVPGFVTVLGFRSGAVALALLNLGAIAVFFADIYLPGAVAFAPLTESRFAVTSLGVSLFSLALDYSRHANERSLVAMNHRVHELAMRDQLTELPNRRFMDGILANRWDEYRRSGHIYAILLGNIDNFKAFNDSYGRDFGDEVIVRVAAALSRGLRAQDVVARWGGDEFLILLPGQTGVSAQQAGERLRRRIESLTVEHNGEKLRVTMSFGVASVDKSLDNHDMLSVADGGLYQAKHMGRNQAILG